MCIRDRTKDFVNTDLKEQTLACTALYGGGAKLAAPLIYSSQEVAYPRSLNFFTYGVIDLKSNEVFAQEMAEIIRAYKATSSVRGGELEVDVYKRQVQDYFASQVDTLDLGITVTAEYDDDPAYPDDYYITLAKDGSESSARGLSGKWI